MLKVSETAPVFRKLWAIFTWSYILALNPYLLKDLAGRAEAAKSLILHHMNAKEKIFICIALL